MTEALANGTHGTHGTNGASQSGLDYTAIKAALSSSSTKVRIARLRSIDGELKSKSECSITLPVCVAIWHGVHDIYGTHFMIAWPHDTILEYAHPG